MHDHLSEDMEGVSQSELPKSVSRRQYGTRRSQVKSAGVQRHILSQCVAPSRAQVKSAQFRQQRRQEELNRQKNCKEDVQQLDHEFSEQLITQIYRIKSKYLPDSRGSS